MKSRHMEMPTSPTIIEHRLADVVCRIFGVRAAFGRDAEDADTLLNAEATKRFQEKYGRLPELGEVPTLSSHDIERALDSVPAYRKGGYVWRNVNGIRIGIDQNIIVKFSDDGMLLNRAAETVLYLTLHKFEDAYRRSKSLEFEIDEGTALKYYDPAGTRATAPAEICRAFEVLSHLVVVFHDAGSKTREHAPILKSLVVRPGLYRITVNEYFVRAIMRVLDHGGKRSKGSQPLTGVHYFHDNETRIVLANCPPQYSTTQRRLQTELLRLPSVPRREDPDGFKVICAGTVGDWLGRLGYKDNRKRQLRAFASDLQQVVGDAGGYCEPNPGDWEYLHSGTVVHQTLRILVPGSYLTDHYPRLIEKRSGLKLLGPLSPVEQVRAVLAQGITGADVKEWRIALKINQVDLANAAGITERHLRRLEGGQGAMDTAMQTRLYQALTTCSIGRNRTSFPGIAPEPGALSGNYPPTGRATGEFAPTRNHNILEMKELEK